MSLTLKYSLGVFLAAPLLPLLYLQGRKVKNSIPDLPEAKGPKGKSGASSKPEAKLLVIGESTMAGVGVVSHREGFAGALADRIAEELAVSVSWEVKAKSGITVDRVPSEILGQIDDNQWDLIVVGIGGNDAFQLNSPFRWKQQLRVLINDLQCKFGSVPIVFTNMPPIKEFPAFTSLMKLTIGNLVELLGEALGEVVSEYAGVYYSSDIINIESWSEKYNLSGDLNQYFSDGVHPSKLTYQTLARQLVEFMVKGNVLKTII